MVSHANEDFLPKEEGNTVLADAVAGVNKNLQEITYSSENMSTETKGVLQSIGKLQQNMQQFRVWVSLEENYVAATGRQYV